MLRVSEDFLFYNSDDYLTTKSASQEDHDIIAEWSRTRDEESNSSAKRILQKKNSPRKPVLKLAENLLMLWSNILNILTRDQPVEIFGKDSSIE